MTSQARFKKSCFSSAWGYGFVNGVSRVISILHCLVLTQFCNFIYLYELKDLYSIFVFEDSMFFKTPCFRFSVVMTLRINKFYLVDWAKNLLHYEFYLCQYLHESYF